MTTLTEKKHPGEAIISEAEAGRSRELVTILSGEDLGACTIISQVTKAGATATADAANTGDGEMGAIAVGAGAKAGVYKLTVIEDNSNAGAFIVEDPDGINVGQGDVATEFTGGGLTFTLADDTDFLPGDQFDITVAAGSLKYVAYDEDGVDGSEIAAGMLFDAVDASDADASGVALVRDCQLNAAEIVWPSSIEDGEKLVAIAQLKELGVIVR